MAKYRPVFQSRYSSRYVMEAPSEFQQRIPQIDPGFFGGDLRFDDGFGNIGPEPDMGDFMGGFLGANDDPPERHSRDAEGNYCTTKQGADGNDYTACSPVDYPTFGYQSRSGRTKPRFTERMLRRF